MTELHVVFDRTVGTHLSRVATHFAGSPDTVIVEAHRRRNRPSIRSRSPTAAAWTAPPVIWVWRDADVEPADPICDVSSQHDSDLLDAEDRPGDLLTHGDQALADLDGGGVHLDAAPWSARPEPRRSRRRPPRTRGSSGRRRSRHPGSTDTAAW